MDLRLLIPLFIGFFTTLLLMPFWIRKAEQIGLIWKDMNKSSGKKVAGSAGIIVILGFIFSVLLYIAYNTFILNSDGTHLVAIFALLASILLLAGFGLIDDLLGWQHGGLSRKSRLILVLISSIPLIVINAGHGTINIPFLGSVSLGLIYPLLFVPMGIVGATTTYNFLAGFNGLEAGQGIIILGAMTLVTYLTGNPWLSVISLSMVFALVGFLIYNFSPAKVFPGDSLTYAIGGLIAIIAILGNFEKVAVFFFIPYIIETILKSRGGLVKQSFGEPQPDGSLRLKYKKIYGLTHLSIYLMSGLGIKPTERKVVFSIWAFQIIIIIIGFIIFQNGIF